MVIYQDLVWGGGGGERMRVESQKTMIQHAALTEGLHDWCNKGRGMCYPACRMMHIKEPLLLIGKSSPCGSSRFSSLVI